MADVKDVAACVLLQNFDGFLFHILVIFIVVALGTTISFLTKNSQIQINISLDLIVYKNFCPIQFHFFLPPLCYCHQITSLYIISTPILFYNNCLCSCFLNQIRGKKDHKQNTYIVSFLLPVNYLYHCSLFPCVDSNYCVISFHFNQKIPSSAV